MNFAPLLDAAPAIPLHAFAAMAAFALGLVQFAAPKGTLPHRTLGWIWVALMALVAALLVLDPHDQAGRPVEPDPSAVDLHARDAAARGVEGAHPSGAEHRRAMILIFTGALVIAGLFTLVPGRIMHRVLFGA